jgi:hypothetical protein
MAAILVLVLVHLNGRIDPCQAPRFLLAALRAWHAGLINIMVGLKA